MIFAIGDVHGCAEELKILLEAIDAHDSRGQVVFLGDYVDRGPESAEVLAIVRRRVLERGDVALRGNHEEMFYSPVIGMPDPARRDPTVESYRGHDEAMEADKAWLRTLPTSYRAEGCFFCHAGIDPDRSLETQYDDDLMWGMTGFLGDRRDHGDLVVHGHWVEGRDPTLRANRLSVDTGCCFGGRLTAAAVADGMPVFYLQAYRQGDQLQVAFVPV